MDRRFICRDCGTKWFIHERRVEEPDLTECGSCGGPLDKLDHGEDGSSPDAGEPGEDG